MESLLVILALFFFFFFFSTLLFHRIFLHSNKNSPPSPLSLPIIGHLHLLHKSIPLPLALDSLLSKYGPIISLNFGVRRALVLSSPSAVEQCFTKNDVVFADRPKSMSGDHFTYNYTAYVWASYGDLWRNLRRLTVVEMFSSKSLQNTAAIREEEIRRLLRRLCGVSRKRGVDMKNLISLMMCNIMMRTAVGRRCVEEGDEDTEVEKRLFGEFKERFYPILALNICDFIPVLRTIGFGGIEKNMVKIERVRDEYLQTLVGEVRARTPELKEGVSVVETLLAMQQHEPEYYSDEVIKSIMQIMFVAGVETSAASLEWAMSLLMNHPKAMQQVKEEIEKNVGNDRLLNESDLMKLPYLRCVINETLRLYPPGPLLIPHMSSETCTVSGYEVQKGTMLLVNAWKMHRDPSIWENPDEFKPERFEGKSGEQIGSKYIPFGMGRRACPGASMGVRMVSLALGALVQCFEWENCEMGEVDMEVKFGISLSKAKPLCALCRPRLDPEWLGLGGFGPDLVGLY